jgi:hypothetical protein
VYFWNVKRLKQELADGPLEPKAQLQYLVAYTILYQVSYLVAIAPQPNRVGTTSAVWNVSTGLLYLGVNILGLIHCYRKNGGSGGTYFLDRFASLSWVMSIRLFAWGMIAVILLVSVMVTARVHASPGVYLPFVMAAFVFWWWRLGRHFHDVSLAMKAGTAPDAPAKIDSLG